VRTPEDPPHARRDPHRREPVIGMGARRASRRLPAVLTGVVVVVVVLLAGFLGSLQWSGPNASPLAVILLRTRIVDGLVPVVVDVLAVLAVIFLVGRRWSVRRSLGAAAASVAGAVVALVVLGIVAATDAFGVQLSTTTSIWVTVTFSSIGLAVAGLWSTSWLRRLGTATTVIVFVIAGTVGINADFGLNPTLGAFVGVSTQKTITLPAVTPRPTASATPTALAGGALWANWHPPAGMPSAGSTSQVVIPNTLSHFPARPAGLYLPPAALVPNPPALPLVVMMMGQPGNPDPSFSQAVLDQFAARHNGLAPIVLVADQIGNPAIDPLCLNTARYGNAETYIEGDVVEWARTHLHVLQDAAHWTIAGYSNGGECALWFGASYPGVWGNVLDISGEQYPGADQSAATLQSVFHGDTAAYQATWPHNILPHGSYPNTVGIFTVGSNDYQYRREAIAVTADATAAKWKTTYFEVLNGGHVLGALNGGLSEGYSVLYPRLGLVAPGVTP
jgi:poly(3-hydroxybutyrate) depolymerase